MARIAVAAGAVAGAAALAAGASSGAPNEPGRRHAVNAAAANRAPVASLRPRHRRVQVGHKVLFDASRSRDPDGHIAYHLWDFDGDGVYERNSGRRARVRHAFDKPGRVRVGMIVVDDAGAYAVRHARIKAVEVRHDRHGRGDKGGGGSERHGHARVRAATNQKAPSPKVHAQATPAKAASPATVRAAAASSSSSVTIKNFAFIPKSITVSVGTTVTWTNQDNPQHTATADDGTFDTGLISKGATRSYTFNKAGTYNYHCIPHQYMKGTVVVTGSGGSSSSGSGSNFSSGDGGSSGSSSKKKSNLPFTGLEIGLVALAGIALLGAGEALRRRLARW